MLYRKLIEALSDGFCEFDRNHTITHVNQALLELCQCSESELIGSPLLDLFHENDLNEIKPILNLCCTISPTTREQFTAHLANRTVDSSSNAANRREMRIQLFCSHDPANHKPKETDVGGGFLLICPISPDERNEKALTRYARELERSNRELQEFAYIASHDLQEPLRKIVSFTDLMLMQIEKSNTDYLMRIRSSALRMQQFIEDLLSYSRVTTHASPYSEVELELILQEVLIDLDDRVQKSGATVVYERLGSIDGDRVQLKQLFSNLISNAIKFQPQDQNPFIHIFKDESEKNITIHLRDNGIGIDPAHKDRLFKPFSRLHNRNHYEGSGMGLAICRKIVTRHHGSIDFDSLPGEGCHWFIRLPKKGD